MQYSVPKEAIAKLYEFAVALSRASSSTWRRLTIETTTFDASVFSNFIPHDEIVPYVDHRGMVRLSQFRESTVPSALAVGSIACTWLSTAMPWLSVVGAVL